MGVSFATLFAVTLPFLPLTLATDFWTSASTEVRAYLASAQFQEHRARLENSKGRGIIIPAGGRVQMANAYFQLRFLRDELGSTLPVEVIHRGPKEKDKLMSKLLLSMPNVSVVDGLAAAGPPQHTTHMEALANSGYAFKVWALCYATSFREVLFLDSDNVPLVLPDALFALKEWQEYGNLFWPDYLRGGDPPMNPTTEVYQKLGVPVPWEIPGWEEFRSCETGQILFDRARHADVLEWLWFVNAHHADTKAHLNGDKDTFLIAFMLANKTMEFQQVAVRARLAVGKSPWPDSKWHHRGMIQHLPNGTIAFNHRTFVSKYLPYCSASERHADACRALYITAPLTIDQTMTGGGQSWVWHGHQVDEKAFERLDCRVTDGQRNHRRQRNRRALGEDAQQQPLWRQHFLPQGIECSKAPDDNGPVLGFDVKHVGEAARRLEQSHALFKRLRMQLREGWDEHRGYTSPDYVPEA